MSLKVVRNSGAPNLDIYASVFDSMLGGFGMGGGGGLQFSEDPIDDYGLDGELLLRLVSHVNVFSTR